MPAPLFLCHSSIPISLPVPPLALSIPSLSSGPSQPVKTCLLAPLFLCCSLRSSQSAKVAQVAGYYMSCPLTLLFLYRSFRSSHAELSIRGRPGKVAWVRTQTRPTVHLPFLATPLLLDRSTPLTYYVGDPRRHRPLARNIFLILWALTNLASVRWLLHLRVENMIQPLLIRCTDCVCESTTNYQSERDAKFVLLINNSMT